MMSSAASVSSSPANPSGSSAASGPQEAPANSARPQRPSAPARVEPARPPISAIIAGTIVAMPVASALVLDVMVLGAMVARIGDLGLTPNRAAALGLNLVLLMNLAGTAWLSMRFLTGRIAFHRLER